MGKSNLPHQIGSPGTHVPGRNAVTMTITGAVKVSHVQKAKSNPCCEIKSDMDQSQ